MKNTFRGGVHPISHKELTRDVPLRALDAKGEMVFPLLQHIGKPAKALVKKGDEVLVGQRIGEADGLISANVISSCSGKVKAVEKRRVQNGQMVECVIVDNDGQYTCLEGICKKQDVSGITREEIIQRIKDAGIIGLGGAGFPTHVKLSPKNPDAIHYVIANGSECEPYLTGIDQLMRTEADAIIEGFSLMLRLFPNAKGVVVIEDNKPEAIAAMQKASAGNDKISVLSAKTKYGQGGEKMLIETVAGINYPSSMLPADVGCIVQSIVRDGISFAELIEAAGGLKDGVTVKKAIVGGPIMGISLPNLDVPIQKTSSGVALVTVDQSETADAIMTSCLRCGRCTTVCPVGLLPQMMADAVQSGDLERYEKKLYGLECIQCGCCSYICPAKRPLTQTFMRTKAEILAQKRAEAGGKK